MKNIISEDMLRLYVRNKVRKTLQAQGKINEINVGQGVAMTGIQNMTFAKCEIEMPQEFQEFFNEVRDGRKERVKIELYTRAMKYGINLDKGDNSAFEAAARDLGVSRWDITTPEVGSEFLDPVELELWQKFVEWVPSGRTGLGGWGLRLSDFPAADAAGNYAWHQLKRAAMAFDNTFGHIPGSGKVISTIDKYTIDSEKGWLPGRDKSGLVGKKSIQSANPGVNTRDREKAVTATELVEKWKRYTKARVYIFDKETGEYKVEMVPAEKMTWSNFETKHNELYGNIFKIINDVVNILSKIATYSGVPGVFCIWAGKLLKYMSRVAKYFYEPQSADRWKEIHDDYMSKSGSSDESEDSSGGSSTDSTGAGFTIKPEIRKARDKKVSDLNNSKIQNAFDTTYRPYNNNTDIKLGNTSFVFPLFTEKYIESTEKNSVSSDIDTIIKELEKDVENRKKEIRNVKRVSIPGDKNRAYSTPMNRIDILENDASDRSSDILRSTPDKIIKGIQVDFFQLVQVTANDLKDHVKNGSNNLNSKYSEIESLLKDLARAANI